MTIMQQIEMIIFRTDFFFKWRVISETIHPSISITRFFLHTGSLGSAGVYPSCHRATVG